MATLDSKHVQARTGCELTWWCAYEVVGEAGLSYAAVINEGCACLVQHDAALRQDPCLWFQGGSHYSFPSAEVAGAAGLVTPYVLEYSSDSPATYALLLLPLYVGAGRVKNQAHWQTDVVAGWAIGGLSGWLAHTLETPIMIELLPHGFALGLKTQF